MRGRWEVWLTAATAITGIALIIVLALDSRDCERAGGVYLRNAAGAYACYRAVPINQP